MSETLEETLRKSREIDQRYQAYLAQKKESDVGMKQTELKIQRTQQQLLQTQKTIAKLEKIYTDYQQIFSKALDYALSGLKDSMGLFPIDQDYQPWNLKDKQFMQLLQNSQNIVLITGAGMSAASGIPTFRGEDGFWTKQNEKDKDMSPQMFLTMNYFQKNIFHTWEWLQNFYRLKESNKPNKGHLALAQIISRLKLQGKAVTLVTQNIDNYHLQAYQKIVKKALGEEKDCSYGILPIHGSITKIRCETCCLKYGKLVLFPYQNFRKGLIKKEIPLCPECKETLRPHIMFFDQCYSQVVHYCDSAVQKVKQADLVIIIGTSLSTGLVNKLTKLSIMDKASRPKVVVEINLKCELQLSRVGRMQGRSEDILERVQKLYSK